MPIIGWWGGPRRANCVAWTTKVLPVAQLSALLLVALVLIILRLNLNTIRVPCAKPEYSLNSLVADFAPHYELGSYPHQRVRIVFYILHLILTLSGPDVQPLVPPVPHRHCPLETRLRTQVCIISTTSGHIYIY